LLLFLCCSSLLPACMLLLLALNSCSLSQASMDLLCV
jgi:hypothetical protein